MPTTLQATRACRRPRMLSRWVDRPSSHTRAGNGKSITLYDGSLSSRTRGR